ncbi:MAG: Hsp33 family molecular chaperone HslO [Thermoanaerobaculia bacterium]
MNQQDRLIQGMAFGGDFRIIAALTTSALEAARELRDMSPVATSALGRAMTGALLLARLLDKNVRNQYVTLRIDGGGPLGLVIAEGTIAGHVRGFVEHPLVEGGANDVGRVIGANGLMTIVRGTPPAGKPYTTQQRLVSGEIAKDLAQYLSSSEQVASAVLLGVMERPDGVSASGGMVIQAFPHATPESIRAMEDRVRSAAPFSTLLDRLALEDAVRSVLDGIDYKPIDSSFDIPIRYTCRCTRDRALSQFHLFSRQELADMIARENGAEAVCQFCGRCYRFSADELLALSHGADA